jgi:hypothetical protein
MPALLRAARAKAARSSDAADGRIAKLGPSAMGATFDGGRSGRGAPERPVGSQITGLAIRLTEPDGPPIFAHLLPLRGSDFRTRLQPAPLPPSSWCAAGRTGWCRRRGCRLWSDASRNRSSGQPVLPARADRDPLPARADRDRRNAWGPTTKTHLEHIFLNTRVTR